MEQQNPVRAARRETRGDRKLRARRGPRRFELKEALKQQWLQRAA
jgi:hypothetical protein